MADFRDISAFPGVGVQHPCQKLPPHHLSSDINSWLLDISKSFSEFKGPIFTFGFGNWLAQTTGINATNSPLFAGTLKCEQAMRSPIGKSLPFSSPGECRREIIQAPEQLEGPCGDTEVVEMVPLEIGNKKKVEAYYESAFKAFQQINCRQVAKAYIKIIEPRKQGKHPYNGGPRSPGGTRDPERTKPDWWPAGVPHREPDHLKKPERIQLLIHIFRRLGRSHGISVNALEEAGQDAQRLIKPREKLLVLDEIYKVRRAEEIYERGEADASTIIYVAKRDPKPQEDPQDIDDSTGAANDSNRRLSTRKRERDIEVQDAKSRARPPSPVISTIEGISASHDQLSFVTNSNSVCRGIEERRPSQPPPRMGVECSPLSVATSNISPLLPALDPTYLEHLGFYGSRKPLLSTDYPEQHCTRELTPSYSCHNAWNHQNFGPEYVPQVYMNTQWNN